jgi:hypothetical protein
MAQQQPGMHEGGCLDAAGLSLRPQRSGGACLVTSLVALTVLVAGWQLNWHSMAHDPPAVLLYAAAGPVVNREGVRLHLDFR